MALLRLAKSMPNRRLGPHYLDSVSKLAWLLPFALGETERRFPVSEFKLGPKEKIGDVMAQRLDYRFDVKGQKQPNGDDAPLHASVWIDTKTSLPLKRAITWKFAGVQVMSIDESYENLVIDQEIDSAKFKGARIVTWIPYRVVRRGADILVCRNAGQASPFGSEPQRRRQPVQRDAADF